MNDNANDLVTVTIKPRWENQYIRGGYLGVELIDRPIRRGYTERLLGFDAAGQPIVECAEVQS